MNRMICDFFYRKWQGDWYNCNDQYPLEYLITHILEASQSEENISISRSLKDCLINVLTNFGFLESRASSFGIQALVSDLLRAVIYLERNNTPSRLRQLLLLIYRETQNLHDWNKTNNPIFFAQQLHNRAISMGLTDVIEPSRKRVHEAKEASICLNWLLLGYRPI